MSDIKKLTPEEYWEWRTTIAEMGEAKSDLNIANLKLAMQAKDIEIAQLKLHAFKQVVRAAQDKKNTYDSEYKRFKGKIEERLGISLDNKVIDDVTFEVKEIDNGTS